MHAAATEEEEVRSYRIPSLQSCITLPAHSAHPPVCEQLPWPSRTWSSTRTAQTGTCQNFPRMTRPTGTLGALCARGSWRPACARRGPLTNMLLM